MNPKILQWEKDLNQITADFKHRLQNLSSCELNHKPDPNTWSIAEILDHLIRINESYYPVLKQVRQGTQKLPFISKFAFFTNRLGNAILKSVSPGREKKIKTFPIWEPRTGNLSGNMLEKFEKHQREFISFLKNQEDLLDKNVIISSPANRMIVYRLETAFEILVSHEKRHYNQALEVLSRLK